MNHGIVWSASSFIWGSSGDGWETITISSKVIDNFGWLYASFNVIVRKFESDCLDLSVVIVADQLWTSGTIFINWYLKTTSSGKEKQHISVVQFEQMSSQLSGIVWSWFLWFEFRGILRGRLFVWGSDKFSLCVGLLTRPERVVVGVAFLATDVVEYLFSTSSRLRELSGFDFSTRFWVWDLTLAFVFGHGSGSKVRSFSWSGSSVLTGNLVNSSRIWFPAGLPDACGSLSSFRVVYSLMCFSTSNCPSVMAGSPHGRMYCLIWSMWTFLGSTFGL